MQAQPAPMVVGPIHQRSSDTIQAAVKRAERRIAPLWPLRHFVAVNPYLGLLEHHFEAAAHILGRRAGARMTAPRAFYAQAIRNGRITDADLRAALAEGGTLRGSHIDIDTLKAFAMHDTTEIAFIPLPTVADVAHTVTGVHWGEIATESISSWAGAYFDLGQTYWKSPWADLPPYAAWRAEAALDRSAEVRGVRGFRQTVRQLPDSAMETIIAAVELLHIPISGLDAYLHRLLLTIHGWAGYARYHLWQAELYGREDHTLADLLAIRLAWEVALWNSFAHAGAAEAWHTRKLDLCDENLDEPTQRALAGDLVLQRAFEKAYQRRLFECLGAPKQAKHVERKRVQAAFCIDVRSEIFRRGLESVTEAVETIGFAGFFGLPIEYVRLGDTHGGAQCPVLLTPQFVIAESVGGEPDTRVAAIAEQRTIHQRLAKVWRTFKFSPISCFGFVGPVGLVYIKNLIMDTLGRGRPVPHPAKFGLDSRTSERLAPSIDRHDIGGRTAGMTLDQRLNAAESGLRGMSLTNNFARIVLLAGHGSTTVNNPQATGLDCGACGGHTGEANARVAALILNDPHVRAGLKERGIVIPDDTVFVAGLHNTTTDDVALFDKDRIPTSHADDIRDLEADLAAAGRLARMERSAQLKISTDIAIDHAVRRRSTDWSQ
ncbi:MAG TPA: Na-translocating system protein MpsB, partial [Roseiflexaceae bacterium]|nr:Na-translocating system protein MpsB [Roseiflexaceae bacterium]